MQNKIMSAEDIKQLISPVLKSFGVRDARLFGSYAKGQATKYSDIDIYVDSGLRGLSFFGLLEGISEALPTVVDLVDKQMLIPEGELFKEILRTGVSLLDS